MSKEGMSGKGRVSTKLIQTTIPWATAHPFLIGWAPITLAQ